MWHSYFRLAQIIPKKTFFFSIITQNGHCALIFLKRTSPRPSGTNLKGCKGFVACEYSRPSSLPRAVVISMQTCHRGGSDTEDGGRIIRVSARTGQTRTQSLFCIRAVINGRDLVRTQCTKGRSNSPNLVPILEKEKTLRTSLPNSQTTLRASNFPSIYCFARISECPLGTSLAAPCSLITGRILVPGRGTFLARGSAAKTALPR